MESENTCNANIHCEREKSSCLMMEVTIGVTVFGIILAYTIMS